MAPLTRLSCADVCLPPVPSKLHVSVRGGWVNLRPLFALKNTILFLGGGGCDFQLTKLCEALQGCVGWALLLFLAYSDNCGICFRWLWRPCGTFLEGWDWGCCDVVGFKRTCFVVSSPA